jgi:hypothetical protein
MTVLYIFLGLIIIGSAINVLNNAKQKRSPYFKMKKKLEEDLLQANFAGDWKKRQEINLHLLWLQTLSETKAKDIFGNKKEEDLKQQLSKLTFDDIKFPVPWKLNDLYCLPLAQKIIAGYGKLLEENDYKGMYKPDSIL